jgi:hypothetical protein
MCVEAANHPHRMKKFVVPASCRPPPDSAIKQMLQAIKKCRDCESKLPEDDLYYLRGKAVLCPDCWDRLPPKEQRLCEKHEGKLDLEQVLENDPEALKKRD